MSRYSYVQFTEVVEGKLKQHTYYGLNEIEFQNLKHRYKIIKYSKEI